MTTSRRKEKSCGRQLHSVYNFSSTNWFNSSMRATDWERASIANRTKEWHRQQYLFVAAAAAMPMVRVCRPIHASMWLYDWRATIKSETYEMLSHFLIKHKSFVYCGVYTILQTIRDHLIAGFIMWSRCLVVVAIRIVITRRPFCFFPLTIFSVDIIKFVRSNWISYLSFIRIVFALPIAMPDPRRTTRNKNNNFALEVSV